MKERMAKLNLRKHADALVEEAVPLMARDKKDRRFGRESTCPRRTHGMSTAALALLSA